MQNIPNNPALTESNIEHLLIGDDIIIAGKHVHHPALILTDYFNRKIIGDNLYPNQRLQCVLSPLNTTEWFLINNKEVYYSKGDGTN